MYTQRELGQASDKEYVCVRPHMTEENVFIPHLRICMKCHTYRYTLSYRPSTRVDDILDIECTLPQFSGDRDPYVLPPSILVEGRIELTPSLGLYSALCGVDRHLIPHHIFTEGFLRTSPKYTTQLILRLGRPLSNGGRLYFGYLSDTSTRPSRISYIDYNDSVLRWETIDYSCGDEDIASLNTLYALSLKSTHQETAPTHQSEIGHSGDKRHTTPSNTYNCDDGDGDDDDIMRGEGREKIKRDDQ